MARARKTYRRLPGRAAGLASYHHLWLGPDHLLSVRATGYSEEYKRFYFRDIQALIVRKTERREISSVIFTLLAIGCGLFVLVTPLLMWRGFWAVCTGVVLGCLLVNWLRGPTCICHIRTAVQTEPLPTLKRLPTARKVIARLKPGIQDAQGPRAPGHAEPSPPSAFAGTAPAATAAPPKEASQPPAVSPTEAPP